MPADPKHALSPDGEKKLPERPVVILLNQLIRSSRFWIGFSAVLAGLIIVCWGPEVFTITYNIHANDVEGELKERFELMIRKALPEKLEWGREVLRKRLPSRFPEELSLATQNKGAEAKYDNPERTCAHYQIFIAYHFLDGAEQDYIWNPVTFYFELRLGQWELVGDQWLTEWEVDFE